jgi:soluble lytic murein transglycosylase
MGVDLDRPCRPRGVWVHAGWLVVCVCCVFASSAFAQARKRGSRAPAAVLSALRSDSPLRALREQVARGETDAAFASLDAMTPALAARPEVRYLKARLLYDRNRVKEALEVLPDDLTQLPDVVARDIRTRRALWMARTGRCTEARPLLTALARYDGREAELTLHAANCAMLQNDTAGALSLLRDARSGGAKRFGLRLTLAKVMAQAGDKPGAMRELRALYADYPTNSRIGDVETELRALAPDWQPSDEEHFARAEHWIDASRPEPALAELEHIKLKKPKNKAEQKAQQATRARYLHLRGMALFRMRSKYPEAYKVLTQAAALGGSTQNEDSYRAAQALARSDRDREAVRAYHAFAKKHPKDRFADDAIRDAAWLELRHDLPGGEAHMKALMTRAERLHLKQTAADALWELARYSFHRKRYDKSLPLFERYAGTDDGPMVRARGLYWAGRCAALLGKKEAALSHYRDAMAVEPLHWYALLAKARIEAAGEDPGPPFGVPQGETDGRAPGPAFDPSSLPLPESAAFYAEVGLLDDAVNALRTDEVALREGRTDDGLPRLIAAYHTLGDYTRPYHLAARERRDVLQHPVNPAVRPIWDALFPRPFASEVAAAAGANDVDPDLIYAVMRKESAFNPRVVSSADAIGLMQLIEHTAKWSADENGIADFQRDMLYEPATNIRLGTYYLSKLIERYKGHAVPAIAAYNAGEHRVDPWLKRNAHDKVVDLDWFVEDIPYDQTRNYVRGVVTSWAHYAYLEKRVADWPLDIPLTLKL